MSSQRGHRWFDARSVVVLDAARNNGTIENLFGRLDRGSVSRRRCDSLVARLQRSRACSVVGRVSGLHNGRHHMISLSCH
jgi:hypothetical protein